MPLNTLLFFKLTNIYYIYRYGIFYHSILMVMLVISVYDYT
ncbi:Putative uncharacterized protein [Moritella viscosa]|nr:Putative uncharacterized protein [Moritella viscosa]